MKVQVKREKDKKKDIQRKKQQTAGQKISQQKNSDRHKQQVPISWKQSEAIYHMHGENNLHTKDKMTGLYDKQKESSSNAAMKEVFRAENSYGNVAVGINKKKEAAVVVSQKREFHGKTTEEFQKNVHMERKRRKVSPIGEIFTNNSQFQDSAWAYKGKTHLPEHRVFAQLKKVKEQEGSRMLEKRMPFLTADKDKKQIVRLREQIRESLEKRQVEDRPLLEKQKETFMQEVQQKEENERMMRKKIRFAWEKAKKVSSDDFERNRGNLKEIEELEEELMEILSEVPNSEEDSSKKSEK